MKTIVLTVLSASVSAMPASVQAQAVQFGASPPGICVFSRNATLAGSRAGQGATARLQQLQTSIASELATQRQGILQRSNALQAAKGSTPPAQFAQQQAEIQRQAQAFDQLQQGRGMQLQRAKAAAEAQIDQVLDPALRAQIPAHKCGLVFNRDTMLGWNAAADITPAVIGEVDRRLPAIQVDLAAADVAPIR